MRGVETRSGESPATARRRLSASDDPGRVLDAGDGTKSHRWPSSPALRSIPERVCTQLIPFYRAAPQKTRHGIKKTRGSEERSRPYGRHPPDFVPLTAAYDYPPRVSGRLRVRMAEFAMSTAHCKVAFGVSRAEHQRLPQASSTKTNEAPDIRATFRSSVRSATQFG